MLLALFGLLTSNGEKKRKRERENKKKLKSKRKEHWVHRPFFTDIMWGHGVDVLMVLRTHLMLKKNKTTKGFFASLWGISSDLDAEADSPRLFLTRRRLVLSSCCSVYLDARSNSNCNCMICEGLGCKEYEYRTESYAGMITWLIPWLVANDRFYLIKRRAIRLDEIGQTFQSSSYASQVWRRTQDTLCIQTNYLSWCVVQDVLIFYKHGQLHIIQNSCFEKLKSSYNHELLAKANQLWQSGRLHASTPFPY